MSRPTPGTSVRPPWIARGINQGREAPRRVREKEHEITERHRRPRQKEPRSYRVGEQRQPQEDRSRRAGARRAEHRRSRFYGTSETSIRPSSYRPSAHAGGRDLGDVGTIRENPAPRIIARSHDEVNIAIGATVSIPCELEHRPRSHRRRNRLVLGVHRRKDVPAHEQQAAAFRRRLKRSHPLHTMKSKAARAAVPQRLLEQPRSRDLRRRRIRRDAFSSLTIDSGTGCRFTKPLVRTADEDGSQVPHGPHESLQNELTPRHVSIRRRHGSALLQNSES